MSGSDQPQLPPYVIPVDGQADDVKIYHLHTPFNPLDSIDEHQGQKGGNVNLSLEPTDGKRKYVSYDTALGRNPGTTTCTSCQQQVTTIVTYKAGTYAWLMCLLFICCGLVLCCCLIPFFMNNFKDAQHTCPRCNRVLHVEKKQCCK
ncbi:lITAF domain-containing protein [Takifugu rubripes]|uniref:lITAF domain-containing protein n=1 Tax=Takifugu rubripes TaxID=31033 RepID=UPI000065ECE4|nr:lipopolysaccharide-induced tumor necrosis factor-alpha factor homolog [Takifugu rubripes]|eukprot:XP_003964560.1 PREDICTED: lipopolysaccharide-induced tumor necrosis factor-alpha factor homolog [Takifugu rubripes]